MGIITNALAIGLFSLLGSSLRKIVTKEKLRILGICIIIVSVIGFVENVFTVRSGELVSGNLTLLLAAFIIGNELGEALRINQYLSNLGKSDNAARNAIIDSILLFGIGGLQICGPIAMITQGDNSQLLLKSVIDIPFAIMFGATYGPRVAVAAIPIALMQLVIALMAWLMGEFFTNQVIKDICSLGFIILFFSGFNLFTQGKNKIDNVSMLPSILIVILYYGIRDLFI